MGGIGGALGLMAGGLIADHASYHRVFWLSAIMGISAALALQFLVPESPERSGGSVDMRGAVVLAVGLVLPLLGVS
jgi:predicted MFS family arabinose efflux permease